MIWLQEHWIICKFSSDDIIFKKLQINKYFSKLIKLTLRIIFKGRDGPHLYFLLTLLFYSDANQGF